MIETNKSRQKVYCLTVKIQNQTKHLNQNYAEMMSHASIEAQRRK